MSGFGLAGPPPAPSIPGWTHLRTGKVRDLYTNDLGNILLVASDRISAYDWVMPTEIPGKGAVLTQLSLFWFELLEDIVPNHIISTDVPDVVEDRAIIVQPLEMFAIECVARGYLTGSGWSEYQENSAVCGNTLPSGLLDGSELPTSIFTPATKAEIGDHDINIDFGKAAKIIGAEDAAELRALTLKLYDTAADFAKSRGVILADTKFEFGRNAAGHIVLGDEALTPDSSRFWDQSTWVPGGVQPSFDKQFLRDYLVASGWDRNSPPPQLPKEIVEKTALRYEEAFYRLTGSTF
ncbi:MAG: phosphoribosylaminoimidazolesuccinocarboxamide synthase [Actinobacteria bacterium]|uniref:phosphoribosylaminoimidazolesuccinocarboxamide synthase n=1 Tax=freshwater metagenome TaxID=449393 RepID=A0A6J6Z6K8_9ZZZZ|nr:phosphoribosylaminoimidazolesuccinocarboxamide synthase [Actinomycetota bacterium]MSX73989.1 phosphoribosylaminoimidazolesuccinocarboxamide synthase [Actinomycetota bacterium]